MWIEKLLENQNNDLQKEPISNDSKNIFQNSYSTPFTRKNVLCHKNRYTSHFTQDLKGIKLFLINRYLNYKFYHSYSRHRAKIGTV